MKKIFSLFFENKGFLGVDKLSVCVIMYCKMLNTLVKRTENAYHSYRWNEAPATTFDQYCPIYGKTVDVETFDAKFK